MSYTNAERVEMEIQQAKVQADLAAYLPELHALASRAVGLYDSAYSPKLRLVHSPRSRASIINDLFLDEAAKYVENREDVRLLECSQCWLLLFDVGYAIKFKKVGSDGVSAGHRTQQVKQFRNQEQMDGMLPTMHHLELTYTLGLDGLLESVHVVCPSGDYSNMWEFKIDRDSAIPVVASLLSHNSDMNQEPQSAKITTKKSRVRHEPKSGNGETGT
jgi:hypothetical protein